MPVTATWTDPATLDRSPGQNLPSVNWDEALSDLAYLKSKLPVGGHASLTVGVGVSSQVSVPLDDSTRTPTRATVSNTFGSYGVHTWLDTNPFRTAGAVQVWVYNGTNVSATPDIYVIAL